MAESSEFPDELDLSKFIYHTGSWYNHNAWCRMLKPSEVFKKNSKPYNHLVCSKLIRCIPISNPKVIEGLKSVMVETINGSAFFNQYDVLCIKCFTHYYSDVPLGGPLPKVFELVHSIYRRLHCHNKNSVIGDFAEKAYKDFYERGLHKYIYQLAMVLLPNDARCVEILDEQVLDMASRVGIWVELKNRSLEFLTICNVISHYVVEGIVALDPVPLFLRYDNVLEIYVNSVARAVSGNNIEVSHVFPTLQFEFPKRVVVSCELEEIKGKIDAILEDMKNIKSEIYVISKRMG